MTRKSTNKKSTKVTKKDIFETALAIRMAFGERPNEFRLEQTKTSVLMIVFSEASAEEALPGIQETLDQYNCKAPVEILVLFKTLTAQPAESKAEEKTEAPKSQATPKQDKISEGLRDYLNRAAIPGNKSIDVSVHLEESMTTEQLNKKLVALFGDNGARVNDVRTVLASETWVVRVQRGLIRRFNEADWVTKVNRYFGEADAYSANHAGFC